MQKIADNQNPSSALVLSCTPEQLRMIADRLDQESRKVTAAGEHILYSLSDKITLIYSPAEKV